MDSDGGFVEPSHAPAMVQRSVHEAIAMEIKKCSDSRTSSASTGYAVASVASLAGDDTVALPEVLPVFNAPWPEAVVHEWATFKAYSTVGIFSSLCRAYVVVDNKLLLWNFVTGKDFLCFDEIPELLIAVSDPVTPKPGVFQGHITKVIACATPQCVHIIGVSCIGEETSRAEIRLFNLSYVVAAPCLMVKFVVHERSGRIFAAGADGSCYELEYTKDCTVYQARMKLVNHSIAFGRIPVMSSVGHAWKKLKQTWSKKQSPLRDICVDQQRGVLYTLAVDSVISMWKLVDCGGLEAQASTRHDVVTMSKTLHSNCPSQPAPLLSIFPVRSDRGHHLLAFAENGDVYRYVCSDSGWSNSSYLDVRERSAFSAVAASRDVSVAWCSHNAQLIVCAVNAAKNDETSFDTILAITTPPTVLAPFQHTRDVVSTFDHRTTGVIRVDAIGEMPRAVELFASAASETVSQVFCPPRQFLVAHRHGVSVFMKLRPVDSLHAIILNADPVRREELLKRFQMAYSSLDFCCMLLQLCTGDVNVTQLLEGPTALLQKSEVGGKPEYRLGRALLQPVTHDVQRSARDILMRCFALPTWSESARTASGTNARYITVHCSGVVQAVHALIARSLFPLWDHSVVSIHAGALRVCETLLAELRRQLDHLKPEVWPDSTVNVGVPMLWEPCKVSLKLAQLSSVSPSEVAALQSFVVAACAEVIDNAVQIIRFLKLLGEARLPIEEARFGELVCSIEKTQAVARNVSRTVAADVTRKRELDRIMLKMQTQCPKLFTELDVTEYQVRFALDRLNSAASSDKLKHWSSEKIREFESSIAPCAAALWSNGSLATICQELRNLKRDDCAVKLLLHAAAQVDVSSGEGEAHRGGSAMQPTDLAHYAEKVRILQQVIAFLEAAWESNKKVAETLLGSPAAPGTIWVVEPADEAAHCFLFEWFLGTRDSEVIQGQLEACLMSSASPFLEPFLERSCSVGQYCQYYAKFLRTAKRNYKGAVSVLSQMGQALLHDVPVRERLRCRLECWKEALECATEGRLAVEAHDIERRVKLTMAQLRLAEAIRQQLEVEGDPDGSVSQRLQVVEASQMDENGLVAVADEYVGFGGGEVQLSVLAAFSNVSTSLLMSAIENCFKVRHCNVAQVCEMILKKHGRVPGIPIGLVLRYLERHSYERCGCREGSPLAVDVLCECGVELHVAFAHYTDIIERREFGGWKGFNPLEGHVPDSFLCYSMALIIKKIVASPHLRPNVALVAPLLQSARSVIAAVGSRNRGDVQQVRALEQAERVLDQCQTALRVDVNRIGGY